MREMNAVSGFCESGKQSQFRALRWVRESKISGRFKIDGDKALVVPCATRLAPNDE